MAKRPKNPDKATTVPRRATAKPASRGTAAKASGATRRIARRPLLTGPRVAPVLLAAVTALAFANSKARVFVYDDAMFIDPTQTFDVATLVRLFSEHATAFANVAIPVYRPVTMATIAFDASIHGKDASGYHVSNVVFHVAATLALYGLYRALLRAYPHRGTKPHSTWLPALVAALLFGLHPIHTETVNCIFNRSEALATLFVALGLTSLVRWIDTRPAKAWVTASFAYLLALFCKESAALFPVLAVLVLYPLLPSFRQGTLRERFRRLAPVALLIAPAGLYLVLRQAALAHMGATITRAVIDDPLAHQGWAGRIALLVTTLRDHLRMVFWPSPLRASYTDYTVHGVAFATFLHLGLLAAAVALYRRAPWFAVGLAFFYVTMLPSSRLFTDAQLSTMVAERYVYLASAGVAIPLAFGAAALLRRVGWAPLVALASVPGLAFARLTVLRNPAWHSNEALWLADVAAAPGNGDAWMKLTTQYLHENKNEHVAELCEAHLADSPNHAQFHNNCASANKALHRWAVAEPLFLRGIELGGGAVLRGNLARMYAKQDRAADAEAQYEASIAEEPDAAMKHIRRGEMLYVLHSPQRDAEAKSEFAAALRIDPKLKVARDWLEMIGRGR